MVLVPLAIWRKALHLRWWFCLWFRWPTQNSWMGANNFRWLYLMVILLMVGRSWIYSHGTGGIIDLCQLNRATWGRACFAKGWSRTRARFCWNWYLNCCRWNVGQVQTPHCSHSPQPCICQNHVSTGRSGPDISANLLSTNGHNLIAPNGEPIHLNTSKISYFGHSHGGQVGSWFSIYRSYHWVSDSFWHRWCTKCDPYASWCWRLQYCWIDYSSDWALKMKKSPHITRLFVQMVAEAADPILCLPALSRLVAPKTCFCSQTKD